MESRTTLPLLVDIDFRQNHILQSVEEEHMEIFHNLTVTLYFNIIPEYPYVRNS